MPTELIRLKCVQNLISTLVLDKPRKMPTELIRLTCVQNLIPTLVLDKPRKYANRADKVEMCLKPHSDACFG